MKVLGKTGEENLACVYLAETGTGEYIEFVESVQPPVARDEKWVLIVSTLYGCPVGCPICDAGGWYKGKLTAEEILGQIDFLVSVRYPDKNIPCKKFKIQFARMGDPALNRNVIEVLKELPGRFHAPGLMPCISTVAPNGADNFFEELIDMKNAMYPGGRFQMQFSIHSTDKISRDALIPINKWEFEKIADFGERFHTSGERKIALNFALAENAAVDVDVLRKYFDPEIFIVKLTPVNPTLSALSNGVRDRLLESNRNYIDQLVSGLQKYYEVVVSIGELGENRIGSNCGQYVRKFMEKNPAGDKYNDLKAYQYKVERC